MPNDILIGPAVFAGYLIVTFQTDRPTNWQTDRQTTETSVAICRIYMLHIYDGAYCY